jgi:hypothetical protein
MITAFGHSTATLTIKIHNLTIIMLDYLQAIMQMCFPLTHTFSFLAFKLITHVTFFFL